MERSQSPQETTGFSYRFLEKFNEKSEKHILKKESHLKMLEEWLKIHFDDNLSFNLVTREEYNKIDVKDRIIVEGYESELCVPDDLRIWEVQEILDSIGATRESFLEISEEAKERQLELSNFLKEVYLYLEKYKIHLDQEEQKNATDIAIELNDYGYFLKSKCIAKEESDQNNNELIELSEEQLDKLDEWFLGEDIYKKRLEKLGENPTKEQKEELRIHLLKVVFRALKMDRRKKFQDNVIEGVVDVIEKPEIDFIQDVHKIGKELLLEEMKAPGSEERLYDILKIEEKKLELDELREKYENGEISIEILSAKELEFASEIKETLNNYKYDDSEIILHFSKMIESKEFYCLYGSILGGALLDELKIKYYFANPIGHSTLVLETTDGEWYNLDCTPEGKKLVEIIEKKEIEHFHNYDTINMNKIYRNSEDSIVFDSKSLDVLFSNFILEHSENKNYEKAVELALIAIKMAPKYANSYILLIKNLYKLGKSEEIEEVMQKAIKNCEKNEIYKKIANFFLETNQYVKAIEIYTSIMRANPKDIIFYKNVRNMLLRIESFEAIKLYTEKVIEIDEISIEVKKEVYLDKIKILKMLSRQKEIPEIYNKIGDLFFENGREQEAIEMYRLAI